MGSEKILAQIPSLVFEGYREPEPIAASHLLRVGCSICGPEVSALAAPGRERTARCTGCLGGSQSVPVGSMAYTVPVGYPSRFTAASVDLSGREPYPNPAVSSRDDVHGAWRQEMPGAVTTLAADALAAGWETRVQRAIGCFPHGGTGASTMERESFAVRMRRDGWGAYAVYVGTGWRSVMLWGRGLPWFPLASVTDLREWLADPARSAGWYDAIRERTRLAGVRKREAARNRPKRTKSQEGM